MTRIYTQQETKNLARIKAVCAKIKAQRINEARAKIEEIHYGRQQAKAERQG